MDRGASYKATGHSTMKKQESSPLLKNANKCRRHNRIRKITICETA